MRNRQVSTVTLFLCALSVTTLFAPLSWGADTGATQLKAALTINISNYIGWPALPDDHFLITCYGPSSECDVLKSFEGKLRKGKPIKIRVSEQTETLKKAQLVFIASQYSSQLPLLSKKLRDSSTLLISESSSEHHSHSMIELVKKKGHYEFLVNRPNIIHEGLTLDPKLLLIGGTEMDVIRLYREMEEKNLKAQESNRQIEAELKRRQAELNQVRVRLSEREAKLKEKEQELAMIQGQVVDAKQSLKSKTTQFVDKETELATMISQLEEKERAVQAQQDTVNKLTNEINQQLELFNQLEMDILKQNQQLSKQSSQLEQQNQKLETHNTLMLLGVLIISTVLLTASIVYRFYLQNRRTNRELSHTLSILKETQGKLVESEKMASLGSLVTGMAHELNTPIGTSICCVSSMGESVREVDESIKNNTLTKAKMMAFLDLVQESESLLTTSLKRCADLVHNFKQVSADQAVSEPREFQLKSYLAEIFGTLSVQLKRAKVEYILEGDNPALLLDPGIIVQIITNLTMNAVNHAFEGIQSPRIKVSVTRQTQGVEISFADNGVGMNDDVKHKIFDPFFTTKRGTGGTGLGMNIVYNLITTQLHGQIDVYSEPGKGCLFKIQFPYTGDEPR